MLWLSSQGRSADALWNERKRGTHFFQQFGGSVHGQGQPDFSDHRLQYSNAEICGVDCVLLIFGQGPLLIRADEHIAGVPSIVRMLAERAIAVEASHGPHRMSW